ncbi:Bifunctional DNA primase/polymerase [Elusimicrobium minutum Pei191]|uniref:Bifunctional DNA primase/polymerase n=1 Tax=Elusimicrobium minutum (strain Pei191) TaxID=445932 RepID=B2KEQ3_ELUMP|nr:bifunctional DNA primase/polymerase [Elusimicrobium minutum]ACC98999.1 Bifunctional DNA primase/polymerase [Elusimicrobium minutum Pei191]
MTIETINPVLAKQLRRGFKVFPVWYPKEKKCACFNASCNCPAKHPMFKGGHKIASSNISQIKNWTTSIKESCNWAVATGKPSNIVVVDIDFRKDGDKSIAPYNLPSTYTVSTGNGFHYYFKLPMQYQYLASKINLLQGVDFKANGGYVIIPPSIHISGAAYKMHNDITIADIPANLLEVILRQVKNNIFREGERNSQLFRIGVGFAYNRSKEKSRLTKYLSVVNEDRCYPPLAFEEVRTLANNIIKTICRRTTAL